MEIASADSSATVSSDRRRSDWIVVLLLVVGTLVLYGRVAQFDFINYDDELYVKDNPRMAGGLSASAIGWAFTTGERSNWHPLTWISHLVDSQLFGLRPGPMHLVNAVIHAINTALLYALLVSMTGRQPAAAWVAAMFAVHPLHVESVAWISERKDVLSTLFMLLALIAYVWYVRKPHLKGYLLVLFLFLLGLLSKPMVVTLPFVMLLLDIWPLRRPWGDTTARSRIGALIVEKMPMFALAILSSAITILVQSAGHSVASTYSMPIVTRLINAVVAYATYLRMTFAPYGLAVFYPHPASYPAGVIAPESVILACGILVAITTLAISVGRKLPWLPVGWLWFLGTLVPVIGVVQVGQQAMADRYTYVPLIGIFIAIAWSAALLCQRMRGVGGVLVNILAVASVAISCSISWRQIGYWRNSETLMRRAIDVVPNNYVAHASLGQVYDDRGDTVAAAAEYEAALAIKPDESVALYNLALQAHVKGDLDRAITLYKRVIEVDPSYLDTYNNYGNLLAGRGENRQAIEIYKTGIAVGANDARIYHNLALAFARDGKLRDAIDAWRKALSIDPTHKEAQQGLAQALKLVGGGAQDQ